MHRFLLLLALAILTSGCRIQSPSIEPSLIPTATVAPTFPVTPTRTATPQTTPTETNPYLITQCLPVQDTLPEGLASDAVLVMQNIQDGPQIRENYGLDLNTNSRFLVNQPLEGFLDGIITPDGKWIVYRRSHWDSTLEKYTDTDIVLASLDGHKYQLSPERIFSDNPDWFFMNISRFLDNSHLLVGFNDPSSTSRVTNTVQIWNPFTGEKEIIRPYFPDIYNVGGGVHPSWGYGVALYNPPLTRVLYLSGDGISSVGYVLWDMVNNESIAKYELYNDYNIPPRWSPGGSKVAIVDGNREISIIQADGQISNLTRIEDSLYSWSIRNLNWSPDGNHIAFSLWSKLSESDTKVDEHIATLAIADTTTGKIIDTCIPIGNDYGSANLKMTWSPDGKRLVVKDESVENYNRLILVDFEREIAAQIAEYMEPFGWMIPQE